MKNFTLYLSVVVITAAVSTATTTTLVLYFGDMGGSGEPQASLAENHEMVIEPETNSTNDPIPLATTEEEVASPAFEASLKEVQQYDAELDALYEQIDPYLADGGLYYDVVPENLQQQVEGLKIKRNEASDRLEEIMEDDHF